MNGGLLPSCVEIEVPRDRSAKDNGCTQCRVNPEAHDALAVIDGRILGHTRDLSRRGFPYEGVAECELCGRLTAVGAKPNNLKLRTCATLSQPSHASEPAS